MDAAALLSAAVLLTAAAERSPPLKKLMVCDQHSKDAFECTKASMEMALRKFKHGDEDLGISPFDPLSIPAMALSHASEDGDLDLRITECQLKGMSSSDVSSFKYVPKEHGIVIESIVPILELTGNYVVSGDVSGVAISGNGESNITMVNVFIKTANKGDLVKKGCHVFLKMTHFSMEIQPERTIFHYSNLYDGNELLARSVLSTMNEYNEEIFLMMSPNINEEITRIFRPLFQKVFDKVPYDDLFPDFKIPCP